MGEFSSSSNTLRKKKTTKVKNMNYIFGIFVVIGVCVIAAQGACPPRPECPEGTVRRIQTINRHGCYIFRCLPEVKHMETRRKCPPRPDCPEGTVLRIFTRNRYGCWLFRCLPEAKHGK